MPRHARRPLPARLPPRRAPALDPQLLEASLRLQRPLEPVHEPEAAILPPGSGLAVAYKPSLLRRAEDRLVEVPAGLTIEEIIAHLAPAEVPIEQVEIILDGEPVPSAWWPRVRPKVAARIEVVLVPAGGPEVLRSVLMVSAIVAITAITMNPAFAAAVGGPAIAAGIGAGVSLGGPLVVGGRL